MRYNTGIEIEEKVDAPKRIHFKRGEQLLVDHLSIYILKYMGREVAARIMREIPDEAFEISQNLSLSFYDKYHPDSFENIPDEFKEQLKDKLEKAQV